MANKKGQLSFDADPKRYYILKLKMMFRAVIVFACLLVGISLLARGQSSTGEEPILFTSPDGQTVSNALLPTAQAPQPVQPSEFPSQAPSITFGDPTPPQWLQSGPVLVIPQKRNHLDDTSDPRKQMGVITAEQIMGVPSVRQIFGLPESDQADATNGPPVQNANTNTLMGQEISADNSGWAKILSEQDENDAAKSARETNATSLFGEFFSSNPNDSVFGHHDKNAEDSVFSSSLFQPPAQQPLSSEFSPSSAPSGATTPAETPDLSQNSSPLESVFSSQFSSSLTVPRSSTLQTVPQLPTLPSISGVRNDTPSQPTTPSWAPKPAPWVLTGPQLGVMPQQKF